jgi:acetylornithine deacetylase/succinyl-diaminopimelate desuccinylase-like protein
MGNADGRVAAAQACVDPERVAAVCAALVDVPSPTGDETALAEVVAGMLTGAGADATVQPLDPRQANAHGTLRGSANGPTLMLYAPIDTMTTGDLALDLPHVADEPADHLLPHGRRVGDRVIGLGAMNPKGHAACIIAAVEAIAASGVELDGDLVALFGAGGMPTNGLPDADGIVRRHHVGHGAGCSFALEQGVWADAAVIAKSGWAVSTEEVGLAWIEVTVHGTHTYVGSRHLLPYRNPIVAAGRVAAHLDEWFAARAAEHTDGPIAPQGIVGSIDGGWPRMPAFTPASARLRTDVRLTPDQSPLDARREVQRSLADLLAAEPDLADALDPGRDVRLVVGIPGSRTSPDHWITRVAVDAWEAETGERHRAPSATSGATDANILRNRGIPTIRVGLPKSLDVDPASGVAIPLGFAAGMNTVDVAALVTLTRYLVRVAIEGTGRGCR